jgi:GNAT superfamily N-acetyltransferase
MTAYSDGRLRWASHCVVPPAVMQKQSRMSIRLRSGCLTFLPMLHTVEEDRWFITNLILKDEVTVAEDESRIVAFLVRQGEEVRLLYTRPDRIGMGAGTQLIDAAKASGIGALELWCFQANERARRFYEARGFHAIRFTDGAHNEERTPDIRYRWER